MKKPVGPFNIVLSQPDSGCDDERISRALHLLISEKDVIEYVRRHAHYHHGVPGDSSHQKVPKLNQ